MSIPAIVLFVFFQKREAVWAGFYDDPVWLQILHFYLTGLHLAPFWFIPMISLFYLVSPLLVMLDKNKWPYLFLPLLILLSCVVSRGGDTFQLFVHFFSVYFFGMFCSHYRQVINAELIKPSVLSLLALLYISLIYIDYSNFDGVTFTNINFIRKLILCCIFIALLNKFNIHNKLLSLLANVSFGVFFLHSYVITAFKMAEKYFLGYYPQVNALIFISFIMTILLICIAIIWPIKKILGAKSRYLIGYWHSVYIAKPLCLLSADGQNKQKVVSVRFFIAVSRYIKVAFIVNWWFCRFVLRSLFWYFLYQDRFVKRQQGALRHSSHY